MKNIVVVIGILVLVFALGLDAEAQCAMCKGTTEGSLEEGSRKAAGINAGVLYLLAFPIIFGGIFTYLYIKRKKEQSQA